MSKPELIVVGGGLSGCEAAWQAANRGIKVNLVEMRPVLSTGAHSTDALAELVCSNSLGSNLPDRAGGLLLNELRKLNSLLIRIADETNVPAGGALAVDREAFSNKVTDCIQNHPNISIIREEIQTLPDGPCVIASGPLTSPALMEALLSWLGEDSLNFYDAIAPVVYAESINMDKAFRASRYGRGTEDEGDYINCPLNQAEYKQFIAALTGAQRIELQSFEADIEQGVKAGSGFFFERCLPVEILAGRGEQALAYGPMRPVGLTDPKTGRWPYTAIQLRQDNLLGSLYNMVGFQTNLTYAEQERVFRLVPGLEKAEFFRYGQMHRNSFLCAPRLLRATMQSKLRDDLFFAGQLIGVEGYAGNIASGLIAGINAARLIQRRSEVITLPEGTLIGALIRYVTMAEANSFQPMKANLGLLPAPVMPRRIAKKDKHIKMVNTAMAEMDQFLTEIGDL